MNADQLRAKKSSKGISALTAYDYPTARLLDEAGVDVILVGDSLGMVVLGFADTTHVTLEHMCHHVAAAARGVKKAFLIGDLPINSYGTPEQCLQSSRRLIAAGAHAVKLEGGSEFVPHVRLLRSHGIEVVAHIGMLPQQVVVEGGYKIKGKTPAESEQLQADILALCQADVCAVVLEGIAEDTASKLSALSSVPTIAIGCGRAQVDGEIAVIHDLTGAYPWFVPGFISPQADVAGTITAVAKQWIERCRGSAR